MKKVLLLAIAVLIVAAGCVFKSGSEPVPPRTTSLERTNYVRLSDNATQVFLTRYHPDVIEVKALMTEFFRQNNNLQARTVEEVRALYTKEFLEFMLGRLGEPWPESTVRLTQEKNLVARTRNEVIGGIIFAPDGAANVRLSWLFTPVSGNWGETTGWTYAGGGAYYKRADLRLVKEDGAWRINNWGGG